MRFPRPPDDPALLEDLARHRWGPTGFVCPHCAHPHACRIRTRPRVRQCRRCRRQTSITAGTLLHGTHLPLACWAERGKLLEHHPARIPSTRVLACDLGIACSTAWHLNQRMFLCAEVGAPARVGTGTLVHRVRVRRPRRTPPLPEAAPEHVRRLHADHRDGRIRPVSVPVAFHTGEETLHLARVAPAHRELAQHEADLPDRIRTLDHRGFDRYLWAGLVFLHRTVSLRWLPRWVHAVLAGWNLRSGVRPPPWQLTAIRCGRRPLRTLDPWAA